MIVYHGSTSIVEKPDILHSKRFLDFGRGFYVTSYKSQAERWAKRKSIRNGLNPTINSYEMNDDGLRNYRFLNLHEDISAWLDFVFACRKGELIYQDYDIITGPVADDDVFKTIDMYFRGLWGREKTLSELRFPKPNDQYCFLNQDALDTLVSYKEYRIFEVRNV